MAGGCMHRSSFSLTFEGHLTAHRKEIKTNKHTFLSFLKGEAGVAGAVDDFDAACAACAACAEN